MRANVFPAYRLGEYERGPAWFLALRPGDTVQAQGGAVVTVHRTPHGSGTQGEAAHVRVDGPYPPRKDTGRSDPYSDRHWTWLPWPRVTPLSGEARRLWEAARLP